jgi:probable DNA repair protein
VRRFAAEELDLRGMIAALKRAERADDKDPLMAALASFSDQLATGPRTPAEWAAAFSDALKSIGWPGERPLDSAEHQTVEKFHDALREFASLERQLGRIERSDAVRSFTRLVEETFFQPETGDTAVTVTARLEDPVLSYDGIWVTGLHAGAWPEAPRPDPFIPWQLQVAAGIPEASAAGELERGRRILGAWLASAAEVILSWPRRVDEGDCDPSPLLAKLPEAAEQLASPLSRPYALLIHDSAHLEHLVDGTAPPLALSAGDRVDARTLTLQSRCPFRGFAEKRLGAAIIEQPQPGIEARVRGQFLHRVLELLGSTLNDSGKLQHHSLAQRAALLDGALRAARNEVLERSQRWSRATLDLETERLRDLLTNWLEMETARAPFRIVAIEHEVDCAIAGVPFSLRIDRIDELADGRRVLIDYKSGRASSRDWFGDRPDDPQMPLYAVAIATPPAALAYAVLNADGCRFEGASMAPEVTAGIKVIGDWSGQLREWRGAMERLAAEFAGGRAEVDPKRDACTTCQLHSLCRIDELRGQAAAGNDDD